MTSLAIRGGVVLVDAAFIDANVVVDETRIASVAPMGGNDARQVVDATGCSVLPGFVDLQVNGAIGVDLTTDPSRIGDVAAFLAQCGVTSFMPTVISSSASDTDLALTTIRSWFRAARHGARSLGVHLEGPFLNPARAGAHPVHRLRPPSVVEVQGWSRDNGVGMVTIAPELPQALAVIEHLVAGGVSVCAGHTEAGVAEMNAAVSAGLRGTTHLFNAMSPMSARSPGAAGATLTGATLMASLIVDGLHVDPAMVRLAWRAMGASRIALVTDAISALGLPYGAYSIGEMPVVVDDRGARTADGVLAGSVLRFDHAVRNLIAFTGCTLAEASVSASATPARLAGHRDIGRLAPGYTADIVLLDENCEVVVTVVQGCIVFDPQQRCTGS